MLYGDLAEFQVVVSQANAVTLLVVAAKDYHGGDPAIACARYLASRPADRSAPPQK